MSNFPRLINVTGQKTRGNANGTYQNSTTVPKAPTQLRKWSVFVVNTSLSPAPNIQISGNTQLFPHGITIAANVYTNRGNQITAGGATYANAAGVGMCSVNEVLGNTANANIASSFIVHLEPSTTANTQPPFTSLTKVITIAPAGSDAGGNTYGGYKEWFVADATTQRPIQELYTPNVSMSTANGLVYRWTLTGNTNLPWQFNTTTNTTGVEIIFCY